ncbi:MAG: DUF4194 domain-containing protein [Clostridia bacterium]
MQNDENFKIASNFLINNCFVLKSLEETRDSYLYILSNEKEFEDFFGKIGYSLLRDETNGVIGLTNENSQAKTRLKKIDSIIILILRLLYIEEKSKISVGKNVIILVDDLQEKFKILGIKNAPILTKTMLRDVFRILQRFNLVKKLDADITNPESKFIILPSILFAVSATNIEKTYEEIKLKIERYNEVTDEETD